MQRKSDGGSTPGIRNDITGGGAFAIVPADALNDQQLSRDARWLFAVLCSHADRKGMCRRSMQRLAQQESVATRSLQRWLAELEGAGRIVRLTKPGQAGVFRVVRDPAKLDNTREENARLAAERRLTFSDYGRKGTTGKAHTRDSAVTGGRRPNTSACDAPVAGPVTEVSREPVTEPSPRTRLAPRFSEQESIETPVERRQRQERERKEAIQRISREQELRAIVQSTFGNAAKNPSTVASIIHQHLTAGEIDELILGIRPMTELSALLRRSRLDSECNDGDSISDCYAQAGFSTERI